jgi:hypothetical protein
VLKKLFGGEDRSAEGVPGRAVCRWARCGLQPGQRATTTRTKVELRLPDGREATLTEALPWLLAVALCGWEDSDGPDWYDTDVAVRIDPSTGEVLGLDRSLLEQELADRFPIIEQRWTLKAQYRKEIDDVAESASGVVEAPGAILDAAKGVKAAWAEPVDDTPLIPEGLQVDEDDPAYTPIEGVTYSRWIAVQGGLQREKVKNKLRHEYAEAHGIPAGRWDDVSKAWMSRMQANPGLAMRMKQDLDQAKRGG